MVSEDSEEVLEVDDYVPCFKNFSVLLTLPYMRDCRAGSKLQNQSQEGVVDCSGTNVT